MTRVLVAILARPVVRTFAVVLLLVGAAVALARPAAAHVSLTETTPAAGSQVSVAPTQVELTYSAELLDVGNAVQVTGPSGTLALEPLQVAERSLVQPLPAGLPPGEYTLRWRAASGDAHPIEGTFAFTSTAVAPTSSAPAPTTPSASEGATSEPADPTDPTDSTGPTDSVGGSSLPVWAGLGVALLGAAAVAAGALRRGQRPGEYE